MSKKDVKKKKQITPYSDEEELKVFIFTFEEYLKFVECFSHFNNRDNNPDYEYVLLHSKLMLIRKYAVPFERIYLRNVLNAAGNLYPEINEQIEKLIAKIDEIEQSQMEIILSNGEKRSLQEAIRDDLYGMYLHADNEKIENLLKTNMTTYLFAANKYVSFWEELLTESYHLVEKLVTDKYKREPFDKATVVFVGDDKTQAQDIHSASYWSNLRGRDASSEEIKTMFEQLTDEERGILLLAQLFILELQNDNYSVDVLKEMIHPVVKPYWGDFSTAHEMLAGVEIGYSNKIRFNEDRDIAYVLLFRHFDPNGLFIINQPQYSDDILALYLKKENKRKGWKIVSINDSPDQIIKTVNIKPIKALKK